METTRPFFDRLAARADAVDSLLCVGLDPHPELLSHDSAAGAEAFCERIITATHDLACAYKPNSAFFEAYGGEGLKALKRVIAAVPEDIPVLLDVKRGDIASTAEAYVRACYSYLGADAVTLSPYLGLDAIRPFLEEPGKGVFVLCKTSNPSSESLQSLPLADGEPLYAHLARLTAAWEQAGRVGLVVGATHPEALAAVRRARPQSWILAPGIGAQGGNLPAAVGAGLRADGSGLLVPVSRAIATAENPRAEAAAIRDALRAGREAAVGGSRPGADSGLSLRLFDAGCVRFGDFTLKSGLPSPIYVDLRLLASHPLLLREVGVEIARLLDGLQYDRLAALPYAALPITTAVSLQTQRPFLYPRKEVKSYGTRARIEGAFASGETVVLIDDLATTGGSKVEAMEALRAEGLVVRDVVVLIDRESGASEDLQRRGVRLHSALTLTTLVSDLRRTGWIDAPTAARVKAFLHAG